MLKMASTQPFGDKADEVKSFSAVLHAQIRSNTIDHRWSLVCYCPGGNGLEALCVLMRLRAQDAWHQTSGIERIEQDHQHMIVQESREHGTFFRSRRRPYRKIDLLAGPPVGDDRVTVIVGSCVPVCVVCFRERLEAASKDMRYADVHE